MSPPVSLCPLSSDETHQVSSQRTLDSFLLHPPPTSKHSSIRNNRNTTQNQEECDKQSRRQCTRGRQARRISGEKTEHFPENNLLMFVMMGVLSKKESLKSNKMRIQRMREVMRNKERKKEKKEKKERKKGKQNHRTPVEGKRKRKRKTQITV
jgi:hypothetical protein